MIHDVRLAPDDTTSSSPAPAIFSDEAPGTSSPSSSPPGFPWEQSSSAKQGAQSRPSQNNAFSLLGKRKALDSACNNARPSKKLTTPTPAPKQLSQMQISLGQTVQRKCKVCGMEYVPSAVEDRKLHEKYHKQNVEGYDVGKDFVRKTAEPYIFPGAGKEDNICVVDCHDTAARKRRARAVLDIVQRELGAVEISEQELWAPLKSSAEQTSAKYTSYLYIRDTRCVGFLLVQRIEEAFDVLQPRSAPEDIRQYAVEDQRTAADKLKARHHAQIEQLKRPLQLSKESHPAQLGISRIWTSSTHRRQNIATILLQAALEHNLQRVGKDQTAKRDATAGNGPDARARMAFSQPTEAGTQLARKWFGKDYGWAVYFD